MALSLKNAGQMPIKPGTLVLLAAAFLALALTSADAWARSGSGGHGGGHSHGGARSGSHHGHHHHGSHRFSGGSSSVFYGSFWAFPAYWYAQAAASLPAGPVHYIERSEEERHSSSVWYYCQSAAAYYPYVSKCPELWVEVEPSESP